MLGPRFAMLMKGTAWGQVKSLGPTKLADPDHGVDLLLQAISKWDDTEELQPYDRFEKAIYRVSQKTDETSMSYINRLEVAFHEMGTVTVEDVKAFIILRQSCLTAEDKKKILVMTQGELSEKKVSQAMRQLSTKVLTGSTEVRKKHYPANYVEDEEDEVHHTVEDEAWDEESAVQYLLETGDEDAAMVAEFEDQLIETCQSSPDLANCFSAYSEARGRIRDKLKSRGFWPPRAKGKGKYPAKKGMGKAGFGKKRQSLAERIASSHCRLCGAKGHWRQECPMKDTLGQRSAGEINMVQLDLEEAGVDDYPEVVDEIPPEEHAGKVALSLAASLDQGWQPSRDGLGDVWMDDASSKARHQAGMLRETQQVHLPSHELEFILMTVDRQSVGDWLRKSLTAALKSRRPESSEEVLTASSNSVGCPGIIDTGASKTVIGRAKVDSLVRSFPETIRAGIHWRSSTTVFRFGNNGTLPSVGALYIPLGDQRRWMRIEVVAGQTPFLISNAFLKAFSADISTSTHELIFPRYGCRVPLMSNSKGLFTVHLADIVSAVSKTRQTRQLADTSNSQSEVVTHVEDFGLVGSTFEGKVVQERTSLSSPLAAASAGTAEQWRDDVVYRSGGHDPVALSCGRAPQDGRGSRGDHHEATTSVDAGGVGRPCPDGRSQEGHDLPAGLSGQEVRGLHEGQPDLEVAVGNLISELCPGPRPTPASLSEGGGCDKPTATVAHESPGEPEQRSSGSECSEREGQAGPGIGAGPHAGGDRRGAHPGAPGEDRGTSARAGFSSSDDLAGGSIETPREDHVFHDSFASVPKVSTEVLQKELVCQSEELSYQIDEQVAAMTAWTQAQTETRKALRTTFGETGRQAPLKLLEVYCQSDSMLTKVAKQSGIVAERFTAADGDLGTPEGRSRLWQIIQVRQPAEIWMAPECGPWGSFARRNMGRSLTLKEKVEAKRDAQRQHLHLCNMISLYQMERGRHFHLEQPLGSDAVKQPELRDVKEGTLRTCFDMCMVGKLQTSNGEYMRKRTVVHTTSRGVNIDPSRDP